ncbi:LysR family transcriptional regulator [Lysinibacillus fusiformis]|uniref:LysR family transcriptional regulator n=1 Tax=Lysinibacillus fusiformis TaxID=28031 RepID=UPI00263AC411|nr:LysR family transcriptional regulator [Lysinibacillus fusiformis]MDC6266474.1 LysR family transcriptional regulator [Lysinibacillus sphaericus]MDN4970348.1 LysR family transcriptional regulator [Lysinibacillus fusiformis]
MQLLQLQYFLAVARTEHMSQAALSLNITQSSLSKTIAKLEDDLGVPLFDRNGKNIRLNSYGKYYTKEVERALRILQDAHEEVLEMADIKGDRVSISVMSSTILPPIFRSFYERRPNIRIQQSILPDAVAKERLISGEIELCVSNTPITGPDIEWLPILKERLDLIVPKNHRLAEFDEIDLLEAKNERFIGYKSGLESISMFEKCCLQSGFTPNIVFEGTEMSIVLQLVNEGQGISFYPQYSFLGEQLANTKIIRLKNSHCYQTVGFAWLKSKKYSYVSKQFRQHMIQAFTDINKKNYSN